MTAHLEQTHTLESLAARAVMSERNFTRHFRQATGTSFKQWILNQRLAQAQRMLESSKVSIEVVAQKTGFGTSLSLRKHFQAALHLSPSAYRKQFRAHAPGTPAQDRRSQLSRHLASAAAGTGIAAMSERNLARVAVMRS